MSGRRRRWVEPLLLAVPVLAGAGWWVATASDDGAGSDPLAISAAGPSYASLEQLVAASDLIVLGEVSATDPGRTLTDPADPTAGIITRLVRLEVVETFVGQAPGPLLIEEESALVDGTPIVVNGVEPSRVGDRGVYFLVAGAGTDAPYHALVNEQGRYLWQGPGLSPSGSDRLSTAIAAAGGDALVAELRP